MLSDVCVSSSTIRAVVSDLSLWLNCSINVHNKIIITSIVWVKILKLNNEEWTNVITRY